MGETFYDVLGVSREASQEEITTAYRERVLETHPDRNDDPDAADEFKRVTTAEEVLSDETERARYDRLGHESYVQLSEDWADIDDESTQTTTGQSSTSDMGGGRTRQTTNERRADGPSHHAHQRRQRQRNRRQAAQEADRGWWIGEETGETDSHSNTTHGANTTHGTTATGAQSGQTEDTFQYSVHDWTDDVTVEQDQPTIGPHTAVFITCLALIYPILVYASVAPLFPFGINLLVGICTLVIVGYLLTIPRIAIVIFGSWSFVATALVPQLGVFEPFSLLVLVVIGAFWGPLGYAVAIWWALRL